MKSRFIGCLAGGAAGDALGYPVEFMGYRKIKKEYGSDGIKEFDFKKGKALISDDTQMTMFTAAALIDAEDSLKYDQEECIFLAYLDWYDTQDPTKGYQSFTDLYDIKEMHSMRCPGNTCLSALRFQKEGRKGWVDQPVNDSKGCGGVMRVAPIGLLRRNSIKKSIAMLGAEAAAITHGHPLGYLPAAAMAELIHQIVYWKEGDGSMKRILETTMKSVSTQFEEIPYLPDFLKIVEKAMMLVGEDIEDRAAIQKIGEGWVAEEAFAIAVYSSLKYSRDFKKALVCAVNHDGDSDSTGAMTGNILGAYLGVGDVEKAFDMRKLEMQEQIYKLAVKLYDISMR